MSMTPIGAVVSSQKEKSIVIFKDHGQSHVRYNGQYIGDDLIISISSRWLYLLRKNGTIDMIDYGSSDVTDGDEVIDFYNERNFDYLCFYQYSKSKSVFSSDEELLCKFINDIHDMNLEL